MGDSTTTTSNKTAPLSAQGMEYNSMLQGMIQSNLNEQGYDVQGTPKTVYQDQKKVDVLNSQISTYQEQVDRLTKQIADRTPEQKRQALQYGGRDPLQQQLDAATQQMVNKQNDLAKQPSTTYTDYQVTKKPDPRVQDAIDKFGADSAQAKDAKKMVSDEAVSKATAMGNVQSSFLKNIQKYVNGDMSYTPEQKAQVDQYFAPIRDVINDTATKLLGAVGEDYTALQGKLQDISKQIDASGYKVSDALEAAGVQMKQNAADQLTVAGQTKQALLAQSLANKGELLGAITSNKNDLLGVLSEVNASTKKRYEFEQGLMFQKIDKEAAQQAALLGLPPGSALETYQRNKMKVDASTMLTLQLNQQEAQGKLGIESDAANKELAVRGQSASETMGIESNYGNTSQAIASELAQGKKQIGFSYVALAESQGAKQEDIAKTAFDLSSNMFGKKEGILGAQQQALMGAETNKQNQLYSVAFGGLPSLINAATGAQAFNLNQQAGQQNLGISGMAPVAGQLGVEQQRTFAENTQTTKTSPSFLSTLGSIVGMGGGIAGTAMTGMNVGGFGSGGGSGGGQGYSSLGVGSAGPNYGYPIG